MRWLSTIWEYVVHPVILGVLAVIPTIAVYFALEWALSDKEPYERGLVIGASIVVTMEAGMSLARKITRRSS